MNTNMLDRVRAILITIGIPAVYGWGWLILSTHSSQTEISQQLKGLVLSLIGIGLWSKSYFDLGRSFQVLPHAKRASRNGLYGFLQHPMYVGICGTFFGLAVALGSNEGWWFWCMVLLPMLYVRSVKEEKLLAQ